MNKGLNPIFFSLSLLSPAPIRKRVPVMRCFPVSEPMSQSSSRPGRSDLAAAAARNPTKNHWKGGLLSDLLSFDPNMARGSIQSALVSFTVVPTASAAEPYIEAAPTTLLVSCIARADQKPNCSCESPRR